MNRKNTGQFEFSLLSWNIPLHQNVLNLYYKFQIYDQDVGCGTK